MAGAPKRRSTKPGLGRVQPPNTDRIVTLPEMPAVTTPSEAPRSGPVPVGTHVESRHSDPPLSRGAVELLRRTVPRTVRSRAEVAQAPLDHREGFILSFIDGHTTVQAIIDVAGIPDGEVIVVLQRLRRLGIITLG